MRAVGAVGREFCSRESRGGFTCEERWSKKVSEPSTMPTALERPNDDDVNERDTHLIRLFLFLSML